MIILAAVESKASGRRLFVLLEFWFGLNIFCSVVLIALCYGVVAHSGRLSWVFMLSDARLAWVGNYSGTINILFTHQLCPTLIHCPVSSMIKSLTPLTPSQSEIEIQEDIPHSQSIYINTIPPSAMILCP